MADFHMVWTSFWPEARARNWTDDMKQFGAYLLTNEHRTLEGLYRLPVAYAGADLDWASERVLRALERLIQDGFAAYDDSAQVVFICKALKRYQPKSDRHITGAIRNLQTLPPTPLLQHFQAAAEQYADKLAKAMRKAFGTLPEAFPKGSERVSEPSRISRAPGEREREVDREGERELKTDQRPSDIRSEIRPSPSSEKFEDFEKVSGPVGQVVQQLRGAA